jgi:PAS domain S-box-containing protein
MTMADDETDDVNELRPRLAEALAALAALRSGDADALVGTGGIVALAGTEKPYQAFFEAMNEGGLTLDCHQVILQCNPRFVAMMGQVQEQLRGKPFDSCVIHDDRQRVVALLDSELTATCEVCLDTISGPLPVCLSANVIDTGQVKFYSLVLTDMRERLAAEVALKIANEFLISERDRAESTASALAKSERFINIITDSLPSLIAYWDRDLRCRFANQAYLDWFGMTPEAVIGISIQQLLGAQIFALNEPYIRGALAGHRQEFERTLTKTDKSIGYTLANYIPDFDANGVVNGFFVLVSDVTALKLSQLELTKHMSSLEKIVEMRTADLVVAKEAAESASRAKTSFLSIASHELRTPMHGVMGMLSLAQKKTTDPKLLDYLGKADRASRQLLGIINDVLEISKIESDRLTLANTIFSLREVKTHVLDALSDVAQVNKLSLLYQSDQALEGKHLKGDPTRLTQILINLVGNALKFTQAGHVSVSVREKNCNTEGKGRLRFEIQDTGIGIRPEDQHRIFQSFEQVDPAISRRHGGTGLGLSLCKNLVEAMSGTIGVESQLGQGSTFWFEIEIEHASELQHINHESPSDVLLLKHRGKNILIVEDELLNQEIASAMLEEVGLNAFIASDGVKAVECAKYAAFDLILMDMNMPNKNGIEATYDIRSIPSHAKTPIVAMTANAFVEDRDACIQAGMNDHIGKPVMPEVLFATILRWLDAKRKP